MNIKAVKQHILEELAHGKPIQLVLNPKPTQIEARDPETGAVTLHDDPDWVKPDLPDWNLVVQWLKADEVFRNEWENARKFGASYLADEMLLLKDRLLQDPRNASAYKTAMEMVKTSAMWGDPKFSDRTIQEVKNSTPQDAEVIAARIKQLREELGLDGKTVDVVAVEVKKKEPTEKQKAHWAKLSASGVAAKKRKQ